MRIAIAFCVASLLMLTLIIKVNIDQYDACIDLGNKPSQCA